MPQNTEKLNQDILTFLRQDELDYNAAAAKFGAEALPFLGQLINADDENIATKAAYLIGYINGGNAGDLLVDAASNKFTTVRLAAAFGAQNLKDTKISDAVLKKSLADYDPNVQKIAVKSVNALNLGKNFKTQLSNLGKNHADETVRDLANKLSK